MTSDNKSDQKSYSPHLHQKKTSIQSPLSSLDTNDNSTPPKDRLANLKANLPPLKRGIEQREKI